MKKIILLSILGGLFLFSNAQQVMRIHKQTEVIEIIISEIDSVTYAFNTELAAVTTISVNGISETELECTGEVIDNGSSIVDYRGFCWDTDPTPTISNNQLIEGSTGEGVFTSNITGLQANTTYYIRAFATNAEGTSYGDDIVFTTSTNAIAIGNTYQGGVIFYVDASGNHGLICAVEDLGTAEWGCYMQDMTGADGWNIGDGAQNTADIITGCTSTTNAAALCNDLDYNGYTDWFLPSVDELDAVYNNLRANGLGDFLSGSYYYWTSTEYSNQYAYDQHMDYGGVQSNSTKTNELGVLPVRAF